MIAAIYARKSTEQSGVADEAKSVTRQIEHAQAYAQRKGWALADEYVFVDDGISGAEFAKRPAFLRLMNSLKPHPPFQVLVMSEESRLGRESIETAYALKQLVTAGVRVFFYLEDRERTLESSTDKILMSLTAFADELEREKARQRVTDTMVRKARAGHVTGGRVFGYDNVEILGPTGQRSHVERRINEAESAIVRRIYEAYASGLGHASIAKALNRDGAASPRPQQGRPKGWAPSSIREVLRRPLYRGEVVWNKSRKRDRWGQTKQRPRAIAEWIRTEDAALRIVAPALAESVDARIAAMQARMLRLSDGRVLGRPAAEGARYLLTGMLRCSECGGSFEALSGSHGRRRAYVYGCATHRRKGAAICANGLVVPMEDADDAVLAAVEDTLLNPAVVARALDYATEALAAHRTADRRTEIESDLAAVEQAIGRLTAAIAAGGELTSLVEAVRVQERRRGELQAALAEARRARPEWNARDVRRKLERYLVDWRGLLRANVAQGQQALRRLIDGRLTFTPTGEYYAFRATGTIAPLLAGVVQKLASPPGFEPGFQP
jgi:site-specific DNA recombinase